VRPPDVERNVDGVAIMTFGFEESLLDRFAGEDIPVVFIDVTPRHPRSSNLQVTIGRASMKGFSIWLFWGTGRLDLSASSPAGLGRNPKVGVSRLPPLRRIKPQSAWLVEGDHTLDGGRDAMQRILQLPSGPQRLCAPTT